MCGEQTLIGLYVALFEIIKVAEEMAQWAKVLTVQTWVSQSKPEDGCTYQ